MENEDVDVESNININLNFSISDLRLILNNLNSLTCINCPYLYKRCEKQCHKIRDELNEKIGGKCSHV